MNNRFFFLLFLLLPLQGWAQASLDSTWFGQWRGELHIFNHVKEVMTLDMELTIEPTDSAHQYQWTLVYIPRDTSMQVDRRPYLLIGQDDTPGHFIIDEKNSIFLDVYQFDNRLLSHFRVDKSQLMINYTLLEGGVLRFDVYSGSLEGSRTSGEEIENIEEVVSFPMNGYQWAELRRVDAQE